MPHVGKAEAPRTCSRSGLPTCWRLVEVPTPRSRSCQNLQDLQSCILPYLVPRSISLHEGQVEGMGIASIDNCCQVSSPGAAGGQHGMRGAPPATPEWGGCSSPPNRRHKPRTAVMSDPDPRMANLPSSRHSCISVLFFSLLSPAYAVPASLCIYPKPVVNSSDHVWTSGLLLAPVGGGAKPNRLGSALFHTVMSPERNQRCLHPERLQDTNSKGSFCHSRPQALSEV